MHPVVAFRYLFCTPSYLWLVSLSPFHLLSSSLLREVSHVQGQGATAAESPCGPRTPG